jgi:hypothetical protein
MHFPIVAVALSAVALAAKFTEHDKFAAQGLENLAADVSKYGYPAPGLCTLETATVRKEWYTLLLIPFWSLSQTRTSVITSQVPSHEPRKAKLHRCNQMHPRKTRLDSLSYSVRRQKSVRRFRRHACRADVFCSRNRTLPLQSLLLSLPSPLVPLLTN